MPRTLPPANTESQEKLCWGEIDTFAGRDKDGAMPGAQNGHEPSLYIGEWITALDLRPRAVAAAAGVSEPYLNQLIHRKKDNPSLKLLVKISTAMGITLRDLQSPPPKPEILRAIQDMPADQVLRLRQRQKAS